jgi:hypothetical protein
MAIPSTGINIAAATALTEAVAPQIRIAEFSRAAQPMFATVKNLCFESAGALWHPEGRSIEGAP